RVVPVTVETPDPVKVRLRGLSVRDDTLVAALTGAEDVVFPLDDLPPAGPVRREREVRGAQLRVAAGALPGRDLLIAREGGGFRIPGFCRMAPPRTDGLPILVPGPDLELPAGRSGAAPGGVATEVTDSTLRVTWAGDPAARWLVERETETGRVLLTPVPLVNPFFEMIGLPALTPVRLLLSRAAGGDATPVSASTTFPFQRGFPQRIGANVTSIQVLDLDGRRGNEILLGDDKLGLWALRADGSEVRHAGDSWTFGLFAAIEDGVFEPVVADIGGSKRPEILATGKLKDRRLHAFDIEGKPLPGFPVQFASRLMTPPLAGDFDGKKGVEILVVAGFGKTVELVRPDGTKEPYGTIGQYNYAYPVAANLDKDRALEVVILDGDGKVHVLDQGGVDMKGFPVDLGSPGRATPMLADLDGKKGLEIIAVGKGTTRVAVIEPQKGKVLADLAIPGAGEPANHSFFYPGLAVLAPKAPPSVIVGTPSKKLFALDYREKEGLVIRDGWPIDLPAEARGVAAADVDGDGRDELFLSLHNGEAWGIDARGAMLPGFPLRTGADTYGVPLLEDLDGDGDLELFLGAADGVLRVWDLPFRLDRRTPTWRGLLNGPGMPGIPGDAGR
ncbi:MAG: hypothetical protein MUE73_20785, partial [Planctomycetes bacterium]|nr:hypothetical protein [Planctomycetota bacterium]